MREFLKAMGLEDDAIDTIMAEHGKLMTKSIEKGDKLAEQLKAAQEQLASANAEIESYKGMDIEGVKAAAADWEAKYNKAQEEGAAKIAEMEYDAALKEAVAGELFSSEYARQGVIAEIKGKKLPIENGAVMGLQDALTAIREAQPEAFAQAGAGGPQYVPPENALHGAGIGRGPQPQPGALTPEAFKAMGYMERLELKEKDPTLYASLGGK